MSDAVKTLLIKIGFTIGVLLLLAGGIAAAVLIRGKGNSFAEKLKDQQDEIKKLYDDNTDWLNHNPRL